MVVVLVRSSTPTPTTRTPEPREFRELIKPLELASSPERLRGKPRRECVSAFLESPAGFRQIVDEALVGRRPLGLLVHKVREDQHLDDLPPLAEIADVGRSN